MKGTKRNLYSLFIIIIFEIIIASLIFQDDGSRYNFYVLFLQFFISTFCIVKIFRFPSFNFSQNTIFHLFFLFFFGIAPALQFKKNIIFWGSINKFTQEEFIAWNMIIVMILVIYNVSYETFRSKFNRKLKNKHPISNEKTKPRTFLLIILSFLSFGIFAYSKNFNLMGILLRGGIPGLEGTSNIDDSSITLIINIFVRPIPLIALLMYKLYTDSTKISKWEAILLILALISNFPTGMARFQAAALYIPVVLVYFKSLSKSLNFSLLFCFGLLIIFPFLNQFRNFDKMRSGKMIDTDMFTTTHFDSYQNTLSVINNQTITYGKQLLGVIFFYIPRSWWQDKPIGSGSFFAQEQKYDFSNISLSFLGEGYINFGFLGLFVFVIFFSYINSKMDNAYWNSPHMNGYEILKYLFSLGMFFFILRGDLLSSFAYTVGLLLSVYCVYKLAFTKKK